MMFAHPYMAIYRRTLGLTCQQMARMCQCSEGLLRMIEEDGEITHPNIAARIAAAYKLDVNGYNALVHEDHRADVLPEPKMPPDWSDWKHFKYNESLTEVEMQC